MVTEAKKTSVDRPSELSPDQIREHYPEFARLLMERRNEILPQEESTRANLDEQVLTSPGDDADMSVVDTSADYFMRLSNHHQRELIEIREALDRMHRGVYGVCESCEEAIALERLRRLPFARFCVDCQAALEKEAQVARLGPTGTKPKL